LHATNEQFATEPEQIRPLQGQNARNAVRVPVSYRTFSHGWAFRPQLGDIALTQLHYREAANFLLAAAEQVPNGHDSVQRNYQDRAASAVQDSIEGYVSGLHRNAKTLSIIAAALDRDSSYITSAGIGVTMDDASTVQGIMITEVAPHSPASQAGLVEGDIIVAIDKTSTVGFNVPETISRLRGQDGTPVSVALLRNGKPRELKLIRAPLVHAKQIMREAMIRSIGSLHDINAKLNYELDNEINKVSNMNVDPRNPLAALANLAAHVANLQEYVIEIKSHVLQSSEDLLVETPGQNIFRRFVSMMNMINGGEGENWEKYSATLDQEIDHLSDFYKSQIMICIYFFGTTESLQVELQGKARSALREFSITAHARLMELTGLSSQN